MNESEHKWIETNNQVCGLLRMAHDLLACSSLPPRRTWVGLTNDEQQQAYEQWQNDGWGVFYNAIEAKLKEKNT